MKANIERLEQIAVELSHSGLCNSAARVREAIGELKDLRDHMAIIRDMTAPRHSLHDANTCAAQALEQWERCEECGGRGFFEDGGGADWECVNCGGEGSLFYPADSA